MGYERTNIVFYSDVRVSDDLRLGEAGQGLHVIRVALEAEQNVARSSRTSQLYEAALAWARSAADGNGAPMLDDPSVRRRLARPAIDAEVTELLGYRVGFLEQLGAKPGPHAASVRARELCPMVQRGPRHGRTRRHGRLDRPRDRTGRHVRVPLPLFGGQHHLRRVQRGSAKPDCRTAPRVTA